MISLDNLNQVKHILNDEFVGELKLLYLKSKENGLKVDIGSDIVSGIGSNMQKKKPSRKHADMNINKTNNKNNKIWKCNVCGYPAKYRSTLAIHQRVHTGEKPIKCTICNKGFARKDYLTKHLRYHTGEKPHKCYICLKSFKQRSGLTSHIRNVHTKINNHPQHYQQQQTFIP